MVLFILQHRSPRPHAPSHSTSIPSRPEATARPGAARAWEHRCLRPSRGPTWEPASVCAWRCHQSLRTQGDRAHCACLGRGHLHGHQHGGEDLLQEARGHPCTRSASPQPSQLGRVRDVVLGCLRLAPGLASSGERFGRGSCVAEGIVVGAEPSVRWPDPAGWVQVAADSFLSGRQRCGHALATVWTAPVMSPEAGLGSFGYFHEAG